MNDRHEHALFIAEEVAEGNLPGKAYALPERRNVFQQNALAGTLDTDDDILARQPSYELEVAAA